MITRTCRQLTRLAAILAVALLCAQTLAATHTHELSDNGLCTVCSASADDLIESTASINVVPPAARATRPSMAATSLLLEIQRDYQPRAPPTP